MGTSVSGFRIGETLIRRTGYPIQRDRILVRLVSFVVAVGIVTRGAAVQLADATVIRHIDTTAWDYAS